MKNEWKKNLKAAFEPPAPVRKKEFLRSFEPPTIGFMELILIQAGYIRKCVWFVSAFVFSVSLIGSHLFSEDMFWWISAWMPLLALLFISESGRSELYEMAELEMATRFSLKSVLLARMGILGVENLLLLCLLIPVGIHYNMLNPIQAGIYMVTPFLLTSFTGLSIMRRCRGKETSYLCFGAAVCIGFSVVFLHDSFPQLYSEDYLIWWIAAAAVLGIGTGKRYYQLINRMEDFVWNLS